MMTARVRAGSMHPVLPSGATVLIEPVGAVAQLRAGEIVACRAADGRLVVHRFAGRTRRGRLLTRGDAMGRLDPPWEAGALVGRVAVIRDENGQCFSPRFSVARLCHVVNRCRWTGLRRLGLRLLKPAAYAKVAAEVAPRAARQSVRRYQGMNRFETQQLGNQVAVYDSETGSVTLLSAMAHAIWRVARDGQPKERVRSIMVERYPATPPEEIERDLEQSWSKLQSAGLLA